MNVMVLRFDAPLMSFGSVIVDHINRTDQFPYRAMLVGLMANAMGLSRRDADAHESLQSRLTYAARQDRSGIVLMDFHTVDFSPAGSMSSDRGWTAEGKLEERKGGDASEGTHIRHRYYLADAIVTAACSVAGPDDDLGFSAVVSALRSPARPLFLGRKCCIPSTPVLMGTTEAASPREALLGVARVETRGNDGPLNAVWPQADDPDTAHPLWPRVEDREWDSAIHVGRRMYVRGQMDPPSGLDGGEERP